MRTRRLHARLAYVVRVGDIDERSASRGHAGRVKSGRAVHRCRRSAYRSRRCVGLCIGFVAVLAAAAVRKVLADCQRARLQLDSHGFADLDAAVAFQCALASADTSAAGAALRDRKSVV